MIIYDLIVSASQDGRKISQKSIFININHQLILYLKNNN